MYIYIYMCVCVYDKMHVCMQTMGKIICISSYDKHVVHVSSTNNVKNTSFEPFIRQTDRDIIMSKTLAVTRGGPSDSSEGQLNRDKSRFLL